MSAATAALRDALAALDAKPASEEALGLAATELANLIEAKTQPDMAAGALFRWNAPGALADALKSQCQSLKRHSTVA